MVVTNTVGCGGIKSLILLSIILEGRNEALRKLGEYMENKYTVIAEKLLAEHNITVREYRKSMTGRAFIKERQIIVPHPTGKISLLIFCHEVGHIVIGETKPRFLEEYLAEKWAMDYFHKIGLRVPRTYVARAKRYISYKVRQAKRRGLTKSLGQEVYHFIK